MQSSILLRCRLLERLKEKGDGSRGSTFGGQWGRSRGLNLGVSNEEELI
jgi:hypothetical protein